MRNNVKRLAVAAALGAAALLGQEGPLDPQNLKINLPADSPLLVSSMNVGESRAMARGAALVIDLHVGLKLRNTSGNRVHGVTLRVVAQEVTLGGKASVAVPSLNIGPGEEFPVRIDLQLMRPTQFASGPLVQVDLDGVLFQDLSFYGPNRLNSRRSLTAWEMEAQRDRQHFKGVLASAGPAGLQREMIESLARQGDRPRLDVRVARNSGRSVTSSASAGAERTAKFAFLKFPDSPVEPMEGWAQIAGNEAYAPRVEVKNNSRKPVRYVELGWIVQDRHGRQYLAASLPASDPELHLLPGTRGRVLQDSSLKFSHDGQPVVVQSMTGFVSRVEYSDGKVWVPNRQNLENSTLLKVLAPSAEEQRLSDLYRKRGINALVEELKKY
jgi:hypothetical protein